MSAETVARLCDCGNDADNYQEEGIPDTCSDCAHEAQCEPLKKITFTSGYLSGQPVAACKKCQYKCVYWECNCDLRHDCKEWRGN
jgi:hypothetical protein